MSVGKVTWTHIKQAEDNEAQSPDCKSPGSGKRWARVVEQPELAWWRWVSDGRRLVGVLPPGQEPKVKNTGGMFILLFNHWIQQTWSISYTQDIFLGLGDKLWAKWTWLLFSWNLWSLGGRRKKTSMIIVMIVWPAQRWALPEEVMSSPWEEQERARSCPWMVDQGAESPGLATH